jgi:gliding motility-associated-like protein
VEEPVVWLPNAFTPNGDDLNDWYPWTADAPNVGFIGNAPEGSSNFRLSIFNRWGNVVYETESIGTPWDGKVNGKLVPNGVYMVKCQYLDGIGTWHSQHQSLTVLFPE